MLRSLIVACLLFDAGLAHAADESANPDTEIWRKVRADLFESRPIAMDDGAGFELQIPARAADAAVVPLSLRVRHRADDPRPHKLYLIIDRNPSPIAGIFEFGPASGAVELETRVRIEEYTWVRAISEASDGSLRMVQRYVKAAGGCSAPAGKPLAERLAGTGQMKWRMDPPADASSTASVLLMIRHPNNSGLAMDQLTRLYDPPYYVRNVRVTRGNDLVMTADVDFSISENPAFRFAVKPGAAKLHAIVTDSSDRVFESSEP